MNYLTGLRCSLCHQDFPAEALYVCDKCLGPLEVVYDEDEERVIYRPVSISTRPNVPKVIRDKNDRE